MMNKLFDQLKIKPNDEKIFLEAITHSTYSNEKRYNKNYQRLEFLGDAVIDQVVAEYIFLKYKNLSEGEMSILRAKVVSTDSLSEYTESLGLMKYVKFGNGSDDLINNNKIKADIFESITAAIYLDQDKKVLMEFLENNLLESIDKYSNQEVKSPKTLLQELLQTESRESINYDTIEKGDLFVSTITHDGNIFGVGKGKNRKDAEVNAAINALEKTNR